MCCCLIGQRTTVLSAKFTARYVFSAPRTDSHFANNNIDGRFSANAKNLLQARNKKYQVKNKKAPAFVYVYNVSQNASAVCLDCFTSTVQIFVQFVFFVLHILFNYENKSGIYLITVSIKQYDRCNVGFPAFAVLIIHYPCAPIFLLSSCGRSST